MNAKQNYTTKALGNQVNRMTWFEFWHPRQAAALAAEEEYNKENRDANADQDTLEAEMTLKLSEMEAQFKAQQLETYKTVGVAVVFAIIIFLIVKYI